MTVYKQTTPILSVHKSDTLLAGLVIPHLFLSNTEATLQNMPSSAWAALWRHYTVRCDPLAIKCIQSSVLMADEKRCWASTAERLSSQYSWFEEKLNVTWTRGGSFKKMGGEGGWQWNCQDNKETWECGSYSLCVKSGMSQLSTVLHEEGRSFWGLDVLFLTLPRHPALVAMGLLWTSQSTHSHPHTHSHTHSHTHANAHTLG